MWAAAEGHSEVVGLLLEAGADPDAQAHVTALTERYNADHPTGGFTALMLAARNGDEPTVRRLVTGGADDVVRLWDARNGEPLARLTGNGVNGFALARDGGFLVAAGPHGVRWWSLGGYAPLPTGDAALRAWMDAQTSARIDADNRVISP
jgi:WD40 repeat protein